MLPLLVFYCVKNVASPDHRSEIFAQQPFALQNIYDRGSERITSVCLQYMYAFAQG